jgi:hypothetical protein
MYGKNEKKNTINVPVGEGIDVKRKNWTVRKSTFMRRQKQCRLHYKREK